GIETHAEAAARQQAADEPEVEQSLHQGGIVRHGIDDLDLQRAGLLRPEAIEVRLRNVRRAELRQRRRRAPDRLGQRLGCLAAVGRVELDAEVAVRPARIVAGRQEEAAGGAVQPDQVRRGGRRQQAVAADDDPRDAVARGDAEQHAERLAIPVAAVTAGNERRARKAAGGIEDRLEEIFQVMRLAEDADFLAQAGGAGTLVREGPGGYAA